MLALFFLKPLNFTQYILLNLQTEQEFHERHSN